MNKVLDVVGKIYRWILIPVNILGLGMAPIVLGLCVAISGCEHKFRIWWAMTREFWIASLKYIWKVFTFSGSYGCYEEFRKNAMEKVEEILRKEGEL